MHNIKFKDFIKLQRGFDLPKSKMEDGEYPVVGSTSIIGCHNEYKQEPPGVVTGRSGSLGVVQYITKRYWPHNTSLWVKDFKGNIPRYVYYFLQTLPLAHYNTGAGVPTLNRNHLDNLDICIHELSDQQKISSILSAYDDLIENNLRRIQILEEMAQLIYQEWFVNFRFPGYEKVRFVDTELGKIPSAWEVVKLEDIIENIKEKTEAGEHLKNREYVPIDCIPRKSFLLLESQDYTHAKSSLILFNRKDILFGNMRSYFHKVIIAPFDGVTRTTCFVLRPRNKNYLSYAYLTLFNEKTVAYSAQHSKGSTIPYAVWENGLADMKIIMPSREIIETFERIINPMLEISMNTFFKLRNLRTVRDLLLSKLISGEIDVSDLDIAIRRQEE